MEKATLEVKKQKQGAIRKMLEDKDEKSRFETRLYRNSNIRHSLICRQQELSGFVFVYAGGDTSLECDTMSKKAHILLHCCNRNKTCRLASDLE